MNGVTKGEQVSSEKTEIDLNVDFKMTYEAIRRKWKKKYWIYKK